MSVKQGSTVCQFCLSHISLVLTPKRPADKALLLILLLIITNPPFFDCLSPGVYSSSGTKGGSLAVQREQTDTGEYHAVNIFITVYIRYYLNNASHLTVCLFVLFCFVLFCFVLFVC